MFFCNYLLLSWTSTVNPKRTMQVFVQSLPLSIRLRFQFAFSLSFSLFLRILAPLFIAGSCPNSQRGKEGRNGIHGHRQLNGKVYFEKKNTFFNQILILPYESMKYVSQSRYVQYVAELRLINEWPTSFVWYVDSRKFCPNVCPSVPLFIRSFKGKRKTNRFCNTHTHTYTDRCLFSFVHTHAREERERGRERE